MIKKNERTLLVDGDVLLYKFGHRSQNKIVWANDLYSEWLTPLAQTLKEVDTYIKYIQEKTECSRVLICLSGSSSKQFRYKLLSTYKHNRKDKVIPEYLEDIRGHLKKNYFYQQKDILEADDCLGILSTKYPKKVVIATIDKDLRQVPGFYFNFNVRKLELISKEEGDRFFYEQCLSGDPIDGYSGVPRIGKVKAKRIIEEVFHLGEKKIWERIVEEYKKKNLAEEYALTQARMARILRCSDWNASKQEPILWKPSGH